MMNETPMLWRRGYLIETGFEVADIIAMIFKIYPYASHDGMKDELKPALVVHHVSRIRIAITCH